MNTSIGRRGSDSRILLDGRLRCVASLYAMAALLGVAGCSLAPDHQALPLPVAVVYPVDTGRQPPAPDGTIAVAIAWHEYFTDPYLQAVIEKALENNRDLRTAVLRVGEARAAYGIQRANQFPSVSANAYDSRERTPADLNTTGQVQTGSRYQVGLGLTTWELDFWGRVRSLKDAALENYLATDEARRAATLSLITQVANAYLTLRELDERSALARQTIASREESYRIFCRRYEVGAIARMDLVQVEVLLHQAQFLAAQLEQERAAQAHALTLLVGTSLALLPAHFNDGAVAHDLHVGFPSEVLLQRPDIVAAEHQLRASHANIGAARAAFFPRITLTGSYGTASAELSGLFDSGSRTWSFLPSVSLPIFDAGQNRASLDLAKVRSEIAVVNYEKAVQTAFREVSDALSARQWLTEQVRIQQATLAAQTEREHLARLRYDNGSAPYFEVLDAQRDLLSVEQQLVQTRRALLSSRVSLYAALGGGSQEFIEPPAAVSRPIN
jgi:outer membrane protein, multidrug efflux system